MVFRAPPPRLSGDAISEALAQHRYELSSSASCGAPSRPAQVRVQFFYDGDGRITNATVNPAAFQACMGPRIERAPAPRVGGGGREIGMCTSPRRSEAPETLWWKVARGLMVMGVTRSLP